MTPYKQMLIMTCCNNNKCILLTKLTTSLAAMAMISAQETLFLQRGTLSTASFAFITVSNPSPARDRLSELSFSDVKFLENSMTEASHPCPSKKKKKNRLSYLLKKMWHIWMLINLFIWWKTWTKQSWKKSLRVAGAVAMVCWCFFSTADLTIASTFGHESL